MRKAKNELSNDYERFLEDQTQVGPKTMRLLRERLSVFPEPEGLTHDWFKKRMHKVTPATLRQELGLAKRVLKWLNLDTVDLQRFKVPRGEESVTVEDLYTAEELSAIFKACTHTRDVAMFQVLYESAFRAEELLSMTFENIALNDDGTATVTVKGKTGTRQIPLYESVPALRVWMNVHPISKGRLWVSIHRPHQPFSYRQLHGITAGVIERAKLKRDKKRIVHMFRHTRATELVRKNVRGQTLAKFMGWTKRSNMEAVYVHLSTEDVDNEIRSKVFNLGTEQQAPRPLLESLKCPRCNTQNPQGAVVCSKCNMPLSNDMIVAAVRRQEEQEKERQESAAVFFQSMLKDPKTLKVLAAAVAEALVNNQEEKKG